MPYDGKIFRQPKPPTRWQLFKRSLLCTPPTSEDAREVLILARSLIVDERDWTKLNYHWIDGTGHHSYCAYGAIGMASKLLGWKSIPPAATTVINEIASEQGYLNIEELNDKRGHMAVLEAFTTAVIALNDGLSDHD